MCRENELDADPADIDLVKDIRRSEECGDDLRESEGQKSMIKTHLLIHHDWR